ncbi:hypothetical protein [Thermoflexus sp.]|uniref:hypothetical protein n=1 Tax=Thermoflexus sp. TaxID=1969742 RepID=UPI0035E42997
MIPYKTASDDYELTEPPKDKFKRLRSERQPLYLTSEELDEILGWKLRGQYERQKEKRKANTEDVIRTVTGAALSITHPDEDYETELRLRLLCCIRGVGIRVASAVLALVFPAKYATIDFRGWRQIFGEEKKEFSISDYKCYLREIKQLAAESGWLPQEVDLAIWAKDVAESRSQHAGVASNRAQEDYRETLGEGPGGSMGGVWQVH